MSNDNMRYRHHTDMVNYQASVRIDKARDYAEDARESAERTEELADKVEEIYQEIEEKTAEFVDKSYVYEQGEASAEWTINHNLNKYPAITVFDSSGNEVICDIEIIDTNNCKIVANAPFKGRAFIN